MTGDYPMHDKLASVRNESDAIGEFMGWCQQHGYADFYGDFTMILATYYGISLGVLEDEKKAMLTDIRTTNAGDYVFGKTIDIEVEADGEQAPEG